MAATRCLRLLAPTSRVLFAVFVGVLVSLPAVGTAALEPPFRTHTAVRCSVSEAGEPELQVRNAPLVQSHERQASRQGKLTGCLSLARLD